ncbi:MAG: sodium:solute symporter family protein [Candidatus Hydrogenedentes bacterium]|nr:sodium:solute symporter family protein [Candidatus Hydrogenedentota bacterium]
MLGISAWDWFTLFLYLVGVTAIGVWSARKVHNTTDFFMAGRRFGKLMMISFSFGAGTKADDAVGVAAKTYVSGMSGIWYQWLWLFCTPFYWLIAPVFRRMRAITTGDFFEARYGPSVTVLYVLVGILQITVNIGVMLRGSAAIIESVSGGSISQAWAVTIMTVFFVIYGVAGGLGAAIVTDFIQGILTIAFSFMVLPIALHAVGGMSGLRGQIADPHMFSLVTPGEINRFHIVMLAINSLVGIVTQPHMMGVCAAGRSEMNGRVGFVGGNIMKRVCTVAWMLTGLCAVVLYPGLKGPETDLAYGKMARDILPQIAPGMVGIFLAGLLASIMSSCDAFMVSSSGLFTQNIYRRHLAPNRTEAHYLQVGRVASVVIVAGGIAFAFWFKNVVHGLETFWKIMAMMGVAFWLGLFWRRMTPAGAWTATLVAFAVLLLTSSAPFQEFAREKLPACMLWDDRFRMSWQIFSYLTAALISGVVVSVITRPIAKERLDLFYQCLHTPCAPGEPDVAPFTLPPDVKPYPVRKLIHHPDFEIPFPSAISVLGFVVVWLVVFVMIAFVYWLAQLGA